MAAQDLYIKKIIVENYKSLRHSEIELKEGLNIIIGKNGAGKSNLLDFIYRYGSLMYSNFYSANKPLNVNFTVLLEYISNKTRQRFSYSLEKIKADSTDSKYTNELTLIKGMGANKEEKKIVFKNGIDKSGPEDRKLLREFTKLRIASIYISFIIPPDSTWVSKPARLVIEKEDDNEMSFSENTDFWFFGNLETEMETDFLMDMSLENTSGEFIKKELQSFLSTYLDITSINSILGQYTLINKIRFNPNVNIYQIEQKIIIENLLIEFYINNEWLPWSYLSDGTKRLFYLISECISIDEGVLLIEEPELGIHPHQLYKILDFLKEQSKEKQIIISTHSPLALDVLNEKELNRVIIAEYNNGTRFRNLSKAEISKAKKYMTEVGDLSTYWLHSDLEK